MPKKISCRPIIHLMVSGLGVNDIARQLHVSKHSVAEVRKEVEKNGLKPEDLIEMNEREIYTLLFPSKNNAAVEYAEVDYEYIHKELARQGVTLKLLHQEYLDRVPVGKLGVGYSKFCKDYRQYAVSKTFANHLSHKPGYATEVDWSGPTMSFKAPHSCKETKVYLFVATLPCSQYSYVEATLDMKMDTWVRCNIHMFEYFGGATTTIICDNLKTGVVEHPRDGEIILTKTYSEFSEHYVTAILPARVKKPRDKNSVEGAVGNVGTHIIASARNIKFCSFDEVCHYVQEKLEEFNTAPFQKRQDGSRRIAFENSEKPYLHSLPVIRFEVCDWIFDRKVNLSSHVVYKKNYYSVPCEYVGRKADLKIGERTISIYHDGNRIATHLLFEKGIQNKYSTDVHHMPMDVSKMEWNKERIMGWAEKIGVNTAIVIERIFQDVDIKEQGYNPSLSILRLSKKYPDHVLDQVCEYAWKHYAHPRYHHINNILKNIQVFLAGEDVELPAEEVPASKDMTYSRGAGYYGGKR